MQWKDHQGVVVDRHRHGRVPTPKVFLLIVVGYIVLTMCSDPEYMVVRLVCHMTSLVVAGASPIFASSDLLFPVRPSLFNAEGHGDNGIGVRQR